MNLSSALLSVLGAFRARVASEVNSGLLVTLDDHIAQIAAVVDNDVQAAEDKAHGLLSALYNALHGAPAASPAAVAPAPAAAAPVEGTLAAPLQADPTVAAAAAPVSASSTSAPAAPAPGGKAS